MTYKAKVWVTIGAICLVIQCFWPSFVFYVFWIGLAVAALETGKRW